MGVRSHQSHLDLLHVLLTELQDVTCVESLEFFNFKKNLATL